MGWYNEEHRHSGIRYVTPQQRHNSQDKAKEGLHKAQSAVLDAV